MAELTVTETMFVGQLPTVWKFPRRIDWKGARARACRALETLSLDIDPDQLARHLSIAQQQQLECAKALLRGCRRSHQDEWNNEKKSGHHFTPAGHDHQRVLMR